MQRFASNVISGCHANGNSTTTATISPSQQHAVTNIRKRRVVVSNKRGIGSDSKSLHKVIVLSFAGVVLIMFALSTILTTTFLTKKSKAHYEVLCLNDNAYGQTFNMILTIAAARTIAYELTKSKNISVTGTTNTSSSTLVVKVGLGPLFSDFFDTTLEPQDDILLYYFRTNGDTDVKKCHYSYKSEDLFNNFFELNWNVDSRVQHIQSLIPKKSIREQAMSYLQKIKSTDTNTNRKNAMITTVHRRNFENTCHSIIKNRNNVACLDLHTGNKKPSINFLSDEDLTNVCNLDYTMILADLNTTYGNINNHIVLLCSDRQVPEFDSTFPHLVSITPKNVPYMKKKKYFKPFMIMIEAWIMTLSDIHYGVPMSTVDVVVHFWRNSPFLQQHPPWPHNETFRREMYPQSCYGPSSV